MTFIRENRTKQNVGATPRKRHPPDTLKKQTAFIWISYFYPPFLICVFYILYIRICRAAAMRLRHAGWAFVGQRGLPPPLRSTLDSVFFYNKTSINLKGVHVCLGPLTPIGGAHGPQLWSCGWTPLGRGVFEEHLGSIMMGSWAVWRPGPGMSVLRGAVLHCPPWPSVSPPEKWE